MANIKLVLNESVRNLGKVGDIVEVSPGYARNYLIPHGVAVEPTPGNLKKIEARRQEIERLEREKRAGREALLKRLEGVEVTLERKANEQGHLFGGVSATDISHALAAQGYAVEAEDIYLDGRIDHVDTYQVRIRFAEDLETQIKVWISPDPESKAAMEAAQKAAAQEPPPAGNFERSV